MFLETLEKPRLYNGTAVILRAVYEILLLPVKEFSMRLTSFTDYGRRVLMLLGLRDDELTTIREVAQSYRVSETTFRELFRLWLGSATWSRWMGRVEGSGWPLSLPRFAWAPSSGNWERSSHSWVAWTRSGARPV